ncbi:MAG: rod shape-determining protein MreC [Cyclobacteriaceae bacterium]|jgi:rod shape-determining protein MreC
MQQLLAFIYRFRIFGYFLILELLCFWLITRYNRYYNASFFNSSNRAAAGVLTFRNQVKAYNNLDEINAEIAAENAYLRAQLASYYKYKIDTVQSNYFEYFPALLVSSEYQRAQNYLTINKGLSDGVKPGMGVLSSTGVVGVVKAATSSHSSVTSLLHQNLMVSSHLAKTKTLCTTQWDAENPLLSKVRYLPRHIPLAIGDSIVTSGYNAVFPEGLLIGTIVDYDLPDESPFYDITLALESDFTSLRQVYVVKNLAKTELDSLEVSNE